MINQKLINMKNKFLLLIAGSVLALTLSCKDDDPESEKESNKEPSLMVNPSANFIVFNHDGQSASSNGEAISLSFKVETNQSDWDVESDQQWLTVTKMAIARYFSLSANPVLTTTSPLPAKVTVTAGNATPIIINVQQIGQEPALIVTPDNRTLVFSVTGKSATSDDIPITPTFAVVSNEGTWDAKSNKDWLKVVKEGNTFSLSTDANNIDSPNAEAIVTVTGLDAEPVVITVAQSTEFFLQIDPRPVTNLEVVEFNPESNTSTVKLTFGEPLEGSIETLVRYKKRSNGEEVELSVSNTQNTIELSDAGNRFNNPDDILYVSTVMDGGQENIETLTQEQQIVQFLASGARIENTFYEGSATQFTFSYINQEKIFQLTGTDEDGNRTYVSSRVADLSPSRQNTSLQAIFKDNQTGIVVGNYILTQNDITGNFDYNAETENFNLQYTVMNNTGNYTVNETLVPKTTPLEKEVTKPFGDMRAIIPGDNNTQQDDRIYSFAGLSDGIIERNNRMWVSGASIENGESFNSKSITIDIHRPTILTRIISVPMRFTALADVFTGYNVVKLELWGVAELDASKLDDDAYWEDNEDPAGTFKADWEYLGLYEVERLDKRTGWTEDDQTALSNEGYHIVITGSKVPVRYIRIFNREHIPWRNTISWGFAEMSIFGYPQ